MPIQTSYPGVYIEEIPSGVRAIAGVATSVAAFVGYTARGPSNTATQIFNYGDFERQFGGLAANAPLTYAVQQFFLNGGTQAWIVRVAKGAQSAGVSLKSGLGGTDPVVLVATARSDGAWGNGLRLDIDFNTASPGSTFNLTVTELVDQGAGPQVSAVEQFRNLSMNSFATNYAPTVVNAGSSLINLARPAAAAALSSLINGHGTSTSGALADADIALLGDGMRRLAIALDGGAPMEFDIFDAGGSLTGANLSARLDDLAARIQAHVQALAPAVPAFSGFTCAHAGSTIVATSGTAAGQGERSSVHFANAAQRNAAAALKLGPANGGHEVDAAAVIRPMQTGTVGTSLAALNLTPLAEPGTIRLTLEAPGLADDGPVDVQLWGVGGKPASLQALVNLVQSALAGTSRPALRGASSILVDSALRLVAGGSNPDLRISVANAGADTTATTLGLVAGAANANRYALGVGAAAQAVSGAVPGADGDPPDAVQIQGSQAGKTGLFALDNADLFNLLCLPDQSDDGLLSQALAYAVARRAMLLVDLPASIASLSVAQAWLAGHGTLRSPNAAAYFPRIRAADPLNNNLLRTFPNSGAVAGLFARTDAARGVWKAPAGTDAVLSGVLALDTTLTDAENGVLNPLGLNCLRNMPAFGPVVWGARTLAGSDQLASDWKYVPVRRLALYLEESLYRGTQWVVFEPNDEPLWAQIRLNIGAFMNTLFRQGAFQGRSPREAYFVKCDSQTTTQIDINLGIVNILVGFAPLKPAEFVIIQLQQMAGQVQI